MGGAETDDRKIEVYFAGLARDCDGVLDQNISNIITICDASSELECQLLIAENDSSDNTRDILRTWEEKHDEIELHLFDDLNERIPARERRIAYLRQYLLEAIRDKVTDSHHPANHSLYVPIDLDSRIAQSIDGDQFTTECRRIINGEVDAVFPASRPYYYDIYALRADGWVETDYWNEVEQSRGAFGTYRERIRHKFSKQKSIEQLQKHGRIPVESAFGGVGIYHMEAISGATYQPDRNGEKSVCEHVVFNRSVDSKEISSEFVICAPGEHIKFKTSLFGKLSIFIESYVLDILRLVGFDGLRGFAG